MYNVRYDTVHGHFKGDVSFKDGHLIVDGHSIQTFAKMDPKTIPWGDAGAEVVVEATGLFTTKEGASQHLVGTHALEHVTQKFLVPPPC